MSRSRSGRLVVAVAMASALVLGGCGDDAASVSVGGDGRPIVEVCDELDERGIVRGGEQVGFVVDGFVGDVLDIDPPDRLDLSEDELEQAYADVIPVAVDIAQRVAREIDRSCPEYAEYLVEYRTTYGGWWGGGD